jgi:NAD(P)-dependent dehydrogenase (short-subunit alcohol dehydrogenase family)
MRLKDKVAIITGAASGIGKATAILFAREGAKVVAVDIDLEGCNQAVERIKAEGGEALSLYVDVSVPEHVKEMIKTTIDTYKKIDILINNAGIFITQCRVGDVSEDQFEKTFAVNVRGQFLCAKYCIPEMIRNGGGSIVCTASMSGIVGQRGTGVYNASKASSILLAKNIALDYAEYKIRANCICPGYVDDTKINEEIFKEARKDGQKWDEIVRMHPLGRVGTPEDMAYGALYLASDEASFVTGTTLVIDGGLTAV